MNEKILLIDGNSIMNRGFFALPNLTNSKGVHTNAILGFLNIFFKIYKEESPTHIAVAFDVHEPTFRHKEYPEYKAGRRVMPPELRSQFPLIKDVLHAMGICTYEQGGIEADDIIGTFAKEAEKEGMEVTILSGDRDLLQLASDKILVRIPKTKAGKTVVEDYHDVDVVKTYGATPLEFIDMKGLMGDTSDNIPGVKGIGEKTASKLISTYHSLENLYDNIENVTPQGVKDKLISDKDNAFFSRYLATIKLDAELSKKVSDLSVESADVFGESAYKIMSELELKSILNRFDFSETKSEEFNPVIKDSKSFEDIKKVIDEKGEELSHVGIYPVTGDGVLYGAFISIDGIIYNTEISSGELGELIKYLSGKNIYSSFLSFKESIDLLGLCDEDKLFDVEVAAYLVKYMKSFSYDVLAGFYLGLDLPDEKTLLGKKEINAFSVFDEDMVRLFASKAYVADRLFDVLREKIEKDGLSKLYYEIELPCEFVLREMEILGIELNKKTLSDYGEELEKRAKNLENEIYALAGEEFNINSTKQLGVILFEKLGLKSGKKTKTGYSTNIDVLLKLKNDHPIIDKIIEFRSLTKLLSTYVEGLLSAVSEDGRIHSKFNQTIAATGRLSSTEPNLQNIPTRTAEGREIRKAFVPKEGFTFIDADYSQIELRVMAHLSEDKALIDAFNQGDDIHAITASHVFKVPLSEVTGTLRRRAKAVNFGIIYGISSFGLGEDLEISRKEAQGYIDEYFENYKGVKEFLDKAVKDAKEKGFVSTLYGRKREIPEISSSNFMQRQFGERVAMNSPIQGTAADIIKIAMVNIRKALKDNNLESKLILQIHDELLIETKHGEEEIVSALLREAMENAASLSVPLFVDIHQGDNMFDVK